MRPLPTRRADYAHFQLHTTRWNDNDVYGHMNNAIHYALFDSTVNEWLISQGLLDPATSDAIGLVAETGCRYFSEMRYPQKITAGLRVERLGSSSVTYRVALFADAEDVAAAEGHFVHVYVDQKTRRPCPIPAAVRAQLAAIQRP